MTVLEGPRREMRRVLADGAPTWARLHDDGTLRLANGLVCQPADVTHLAPCEPSKIVCVHLNYDSRRIEFRVDSPPPTPTYFLKPSTSVTGHGAAIYRPSECALLNYEGEIGVVISRPMRNIDPADAWSYVAGFCAANDVGSHDFRGTDAGSMMRVKGQDSFCPLGPGLVSGVDIRESLLRTYINGAVVQEVPAAEMRFDIPYLLADVCRYMTLLPGDVVLTGTPANSRPMADGDVVEVEVTSVGRLTNHVAGAPPAVAPVGFQADASDESRRVALGGDWWSEQSPDDAERARQSGFTGRS